MQPGWPTQRVDAERVKPLQQVIYLWLCTAKKNPHFALKEKKVEYHAKEEIVSLLKQCMRPWL